MMIKEFRFKLHGSSSVESNSVHEPSECPMCKHAIVPVPLSCIRYDVPSNTSAYVITFCCPNCRNAFIAQYQAGKHEYQYIAPTSSSARDFDRSISELSPSFVSIYNQSLSAESQGLSEICGMGYRKALEFLIKDFLISQSPNDAESIKRMELGNCIANKVSNEKLKAVAQRAAWLGNDFTHYTRRFDEYEINDLKRFVDAALHWIQMELVTDEALAIAPRR